jgi:MoaA/NifB/PqqE/SkfB family radical SAM enzyme
MDVSFDHATLTAAQIAAEPCVQIRANSLYIEPISACNLHCKMCYTHVINGSGRRRIELQQVLQFVEGYLAVVQLPAEIYWCGTGEVFLHPDFPEMVNRLLAGYSDETLSHIIQTNGTIRRLREFDALERLNFRVSIDGLRPFHEWQRGKHTYDRTLDFCREAVDLGCRSMSIRMLLTKNNIQFIDEFDAELKSRIGPQIELRFIVPFNNQSVSGTRARSSAINPQEFEDTISITEAEVTRIFEEKYHHRYFYRANPTDMTVENYLSLTTYGVFSCCNGIIKLGEAGTWMNTLFEKLAAAGGSCRRCPMFPCE